MSGRSHAFQWMHFVPFDCVGELPEQYLLHFWQFWLAGCRLAWFYCIAQTSRSPGQGPIVAALVVSLMVHSPALDGSVCWLFADCGPLTAASAWECIPDVDWFRFLSFVPPCKRRPSQSVSARSFESSVVVSMLLVDSVRAARSTFEVRSCTWTGSWLIDDWTAS